MIGTGRFLLPCACAMLAVPQVGFAHPHIFIDTGVRILHAPDGEVTALEITWIYDELFSLLLLEDLGLDDDFDGVLTEAEIDALQGFDMDWPEDYEGDVYLTASEADVALAPPQPGRAALLEDGRLMSTHIRPLVDPVDPVAAAVMVQVYDPTYFTAYSILVREVSSDAPQCSTEVFMPDLDSAYAQLEAALEELMAQDFAFDQEVDFPPVGDTFAEEVRLTCADGS